MWVYAPECSANGGQKKASFPRAGGKGHWQSALAIELGSPARKPNVLIAELSL